MHFIGTFYDLGDDLIWPTWWLDWQLNSCSCKSQQCDEKNVYGLVFDLGGLRRWFDWQLWQVWMLLYFLYMVQSFILEEAKETQSIQNEVSSCFVCVEMCERDVQVEMLRCFSCWDVHQIRHKLGTGVDRVCQGKDVGFSQCFSRILWGKTSSIFSPFLGKWPEEYPHWKTPGSYSMKKVTWASWLLASLIAWTLLAFPIRTCVLLARKRAYSVAGHPLKFVKVDMMWWYFESIPCILIWYHFLILQQFYV